MARNISRLLITGGLLFLLTFLILYLYAQNLIDDEQTLLVSLNTTTK